MKAKKFGVIFWILGIIIALFGAFVMWHGSIFGENNSGIATIIGIIGIGLIATGTPLWLVGKKQE